MREREAAANKEIKAQKEHEIVLRKEMMRLRAEIDALRAQITRVNLLAPDAQDLQVELASVRASIYDAKSKNDSLLSGKQTGEEKNIKKRSHGWLDTKSYFQRSVEIPTYAQIWLCYSGQLCQTW
jgi:hypothetical protein